MARELFGTDGVRGRAGHFLTADLALSLARAAVARSPFDRPQVLIVRDTRESGEMLESAIAAGVTSAGGDALLAGVLPTPGAPLLVRRHGLELAAVISASHNPYEDNGIKLFAADGFKLDDDTEHQIEAELEQPAPPAGRIGRVRALHGALEDYLRELHVRFSGLDLSGGRLRGNGVVVTVMTNYGFHTAMAAAGVQVATTPVGDRYVLDELRRRGWALGGEQSGHIIDLAFGPSGDGIASALLVLEALGGRGLEQRDAMVRLPQRLVNVRAADRAALAGAMSDPDVCGAIEREHDALTGRGRVLVRASGTEPLIRVMVEAPGEKETEEVCSRLVDAVQRALGDPAHG